MLTSLFLFSLPVVNRCHLEPLKPWGMGGGWGWGKCLLKPFHSVPFEYCYNNLQPLPKIYTCTPTHVIPKMTKIMYIYVLRRTKLYKFKLLSTMSKGCDARLQFEYKIYYVDWGLKHKCTLFTALLWGSYRSAPAITNIGFSISHFSD